MKTPPTTCWRGCSRLGGDEADRRRDDPQVEVGGDGDRLPDRLASLVLEAGDNGAAIGQPERLPDSHADHDLPDPVHHFTLLVEGVGVYLGPPERFLTQLIEPGAALLRHAGEVVINFGCQWCEGEAGDVRPLPPVGVRVEARLNESLHHLPVLPNIVREAAQAAAERRRDQLDSAERAAVPLLPLRLVLFLVPTDAVHRLGNRLLRCEGELYSEQYYPTIGVEHVTHNLSYGLMDTSTY